MRRTILMLGAASFLAIGAAAFSAPAFADEGDGGAVIADDSGLGPVTDDGSVVDDPSIYETGVVEDVPGDDVPGGEVPGDDVTPGDAPIVDGDLEGVDPVIYQSTGGPEVQRDFGSPVAAPGMRRSAGAGEGGSSVLELLLRDARRNQN